jgi:hypothetical protein
MLSGSRSDKFIACEKSREYKIKKVLETAPF